MSFPDRNTALTAAVRMFYPYGAVEEQAEMLHLLRHAVRDLKNDAALCEAADLVIKEVDRKDFSPKRLRERYESVIRDIALRATAQEQSMIPVAPPTDEERARIKQRMDALRERCGWGRKKED